MATSKAFGARVQRVEDPRFLRGQTTYVEGTSLPDMLCVAFVRSVHAHAHIRGIDARAARELPGVHLVLTGDEAAKLCQPIRVVASSRSRTPSACPAMAHDRVRFAGEIVAAVVADNRYVAEDAAEKIDVDYGVLPAVADAEAGLAEGAPIIHEGWSDNIAFSGSFGSGDVDSVFADAHVTVDASYRMSRRCAAPMEGRAVLASHDPVLDELVVWTSSQMPHMVRTKLAEWIDFPEHKLRVIAPDVGGGFGLKCHIFPEELLVPVLARKLGRPVKWVEDRRENFSASYHAMEETVSVGLALAQDGTLLGMKARFVLDAGAYTSFPWTHTAEPSMAAMACPGPYRISHVRAEAVAVVTNKSTSSVYRGVGLPAANYAMEHTLDLAASRLGMDPMELRRRNLLTSSEFPRISATGYPYDSATPLESLEQALELLDYEKLREEQRVARERGRYIGIGVSSMIEITTFGFDYMRQGGVNQNISAYEAAHVRVDPGGGVTLAVGTHSHGQSHATTYAQLVSSVLGCAVEDVSFVQGDTARTPYGWGTWGSRSAVAGGGAVLRASEQIREKMLRVAGRALEVSPEDLEIADGRVSVRGAPGRSLSFRDVARASVYTADVPDDDEPGLEASFYYKPPTPFANATHIAVVEVDPELGSIDVQRYVVSENCGRMINPMVVEGQIHGGVAQGLGSVLLEAHRYDESGQLLTGSMMDYMLPTATDVPNIEVGHLETPSPVSVGGIKGMGEGGAVAPLAAIANAVSDALVPLVGWKSVETTPITPEVVYRMLQPGEA